MKYMILTYASQHDYDAMAGKAGEQPTWTGEDFAAIGEFMQAFNHELEESGELVETRVGCAGACPAPERAGSGGDRRALRGDR